jgi:hypothetical protein
VLRVVPIELDGRVLSELAVAQGASLTACVAIRMPTHGESAGHRSLPGPTLAFHHKAKIL